MVLRPCPLRWVEGCEAGLVVGTRTAHRPRENGVEERDQLRRASIVEGELERVPAGRRKLLGKPLEHAHVGAAKAIDGLFLITYEKELLRIELRRADRAVALRRSAGTQREQIQKLLLQVVVVLELVDHDVAKAADVVLAQRGITLEKVDGELHHIPVGEQAAATFLRAHLLLEGSHEPVELGKVVAHEKRINELRDLPREPPYFVDAGLVGLDGIGLAGSGALADERCRSRQPVQSLRRSIRLRRSPAGLEGHAGERLLRRGDRPRRRFQRHKRTRHRIELREAPAVQVPQLPHLGREPGRGILLPRNEDVISCEHREAVAANRIEAVERDETGEHRIVPVVEQEGERGVFGESMDFILVDTKARRHPEARAPVSGDLSTEAVDGGDPGRLESSELLGDKGNVAIVAEAAKDTLVHLRGCLPGEG